MVFYLAALPVVAFYGLAAIVVLRGLGVPIERQDAVQIFMDPAQPLWLQLYLGVLAIVGAPVVEELLFRGVALPAAARRMGLVPAMALVSVLFAGIHIAPMAIVPLFVFAMALSLAYIYTGAILVPIVMHACFNTVSVVLLIILRVLEIDIGGQL